MADERVGAWSATVQQVYERHGRELWALFYAHCSDADRAHDALQESFVRLQGYEGAPIQDLRAWLLRVGRNWLRDVARRQRVAARPVEHLDALAGTKDAGPAALLEGEERQTKVREAMALLREEDREVLTLRYALDWSSQRIAEVLETTSTAVDMRLSRARRRLADLLEQSGLGHE
ncbi:MAG: RNA polymerase sigma factor [Planctomycetaceae bacterium]